MQLDLVSNISKNTVNFTVDDLKDSALFYHFDISLVMVWKMANIPII